jgi:hypothetical protein
LRITDWDEDFIRVDTEMAVPDTNNDDALLKNLVPLNTLSDRQLGKLLSRIKVEKAKPRPERDRGPRW